MKHLISLVVAISVVLLSAGSGSADDSKPVKRHHKVERATPIERNGPYSALEPYRSLGFKGEFPGDCAYMRANGNCMIDLGYGRCAPCSMMDK